MKQFLFIFSFLSLGSLQAALTLELDSAAKTLWLTGSDVGNSETISGGAVEVVSWTVGQTSGALETVDLVAAFSGSFDDGPSLQVRDNATIGGLRIYMANQDFSTFNATPITGVTATGAAISYAGLSAPYQAILESFQGQSLSLSQGTGWAEISSVPEPNTPMFLGLAGSALILFRRRAS
jgi:hypothetical protein